MKGVLLVLTLVAAPVALAGSAALPGITPSSILVGGIAPLSGDGSAIAKGAAAYLRYVNDRGGVNGRRIEYRVLETGGDPAGALEAARRLVQQDKAFALFNTVGTATNLAIRALLNQSGVPQLFVASSATTWGRSARRYPWTIGYAPSYRMEGIVLARQVLKTRPGARIAVLYEDGEDGRDLLAGLRRGLGARQIAALGYDPEGTDVKPQIVELRATKADTFVVFAFGRFVAQALAEAKRLGWRPQVYSSVAASTKAGATGLVSPVYVKDPADPSWAGDPGVALSQRVLERYARVGDPKSASYVAGMASAFTLVDTLRRAGKNLTRAGVIAAARSLNEANNPFLLPGIVVRTTTTDPFPLQQVALQRWSGGRWRVFTAPLAVTG